MVVPKTLAPGLAAVLALCHCVDRPVDLTAGGSTSNDTGGGPSGDQTPTDGSTPSDPTQSTVDPGDTTSDPPPDPTTTTTDPDATGDETSDPLHFTPTALELADFDGDGELDLLLLGTSDKQLFSRLRQGHGDGSFAAGVDDQLFAASTFPQVGALDTFPGVELMLGLGAQGLTALRWDVDSFTDAGEIVIQNSLINSRVADHEADGDSDVYALWVTPDKDAFGVTLIVNVNGIHFATPVDSVLGTAVQDGILPDGLLVGDLDGDGRPDVLVYQRGAPDSFVRAIGTPDRTFVQPAVQTPGVTPWAGALADMNGDGDLDAVFAVQQPPSLVVLANDGAGNFSLGASAPAPVGFNPFDLAVADVSGTGALDVAVIDDAAAVLVVWTGTGDGGLDAAPLQTGLPSPAIRVLAGKIDDDARDDLAIATHGAATVTVLLSP